MLPITTRSEYNLHITAKHSQKAHEYMTNKPDLKVVKTTEEQAAQEASMRAIAEFCHKRNAQCLKDLMEEMEKHPVYKDNKQLMYRTTLLMGCNMVGMTVGGSIGAICKGDELMSGVLIHQIFTENKAIEAIVDFSRTYAKIATDMHSAS